MKFTLEAANMLHAYEIEFGKKIPLSKRRDLLKEIRSLIYDDLESRTSSDIIDTPLMETVLKEMGSPASLAALYTQDQFLINSDVFPLFSLVVTIGAIVVSISAFIQLGLTIHNFTFSLLLNTIMGLFAGLTSMLGSCVLVFYILQKLNPNWTENAESTKSWEPSNLKKKIVHQRFKISEAIATVIANTLFVVIFLILQNRPSLSFRSAQTCFIFVSFTPVFISLIPIFIVRLLLGAADALYQIIKRNKTIISRVVGICLSGFDIAVLIVFLRGGAETFFDFSLFDIPELTDFQPLIALLIKGFPLLIMLLIVLSGIDIIKQSIDLLKEQPVEQLEIMEDMKN